MTPHMTIYKQLLFLICAAINLLSCRIILHRLGGGAPQPSAPSLGNLAGLTHTLTWHSSSVQRA